MFDKKDVEEYRSITPSKELKERVLAMYDNNAKAKVKPAFYKQLALIAACIVIVVAASGFAVADMSKIDLYTNGELISQSPVALTDNANGLVPARSASVDDIVIQLEAKAFFESEISVSQGELSVFDAETGDLLACGEKCTVKGNVSVRWNMETNNTSPAEMTVSNIFSQKVFVVEADNVTGYHTIKNK